MEKREKTVALCFDEDELCNIEGEIHEWLKAIFENGNILR